MSDNTKIGDRFKDYEKRFTDIRLVPRIPVIIRLDGNCFHSYTRMFKETTKEPPFSEDLKDAMVYAITKVCAKVSGIQCVYQQSDEISFWLKTDQSEETEGWFDLKVQKMVSVLASMFTAYFNDYIINICENLDYEDLAFFDARCFNLPNETEVNNYFIWRQQDFHRNSINMVGRVHFSHKELHEKTANEVQEMLFTQKGINWNNLDPWKKRGILVVRKLTVKDVEYTDHRLGKLVVKKGVIRSNWTPIECPIFTQTSIIDVLEEIEEQKT